MSLYCCFILTALIETLIFYFWGFSKKEGLIFVVAVNVATNILLNLSFYFLDYDSFLLIGELLVLVVEYFLYAYYFGISFKLFILTLFTNFLTFMLGIII